MRKEETQELVEKLLKEIEEEDIGISLFSTFYQNQYELSFFQKDDRAQVLKILRRLSDDSRHHKEMLFRIISLLEDQP